MMNVNSQAAGLPIVDQGRQSEPDRGSSVGQFLKKSVKEIHLRNIFWDVDNYKYQSAEGKLVTRLLMRNGPACALSACGCYIAMNYMSCGNLGIAGAGAVGWAVGSQAGYSIEKEFYKEYFRLQNEASRNAVVTSQPQWDSIQGPNVSSDDEDLEEAPPPTYEECVPDNTVRQRVNRSDGPSTETVVE
ncbi:hypothetical protein [Endozoicomonas sp. 8E]|uniref:hypothetical protein n=1 Tax=Endozoicomonas sp. 8E TaxID=3035692 RepID=UPI00293947B6|nr:hypothetical protein [Endozoicomonas sp. 8E]WOG26211.1 hypothetical protein P6910_16795 [Endozoicomonas sp. 8E]